MFRKLATLTAIVGTMFAGAFGISDAYSQIKSRPNRIYSSDTGVLNKDKSDIITVEAGGLGRKLQLYKNNGNGFDKSEFPIQDIDVWTAHIVDVTGDGKNDILTTSTSRQENEELFYSENLGNGNWSEFKPFSIHPESVDEKLFVQDIAKADLNEDGKTDLVFLLKKNRDESKNRLVYVLSKGKGNYEEPVDFPIQKENIYALTAGNVTADKKEDIVLVTNSGWQAHTFGVEYWTEPTLEVIENEGDLNFSKPRPVVKFTDKIKEIESISYDKKIAPADPHLVFLWRDHSTNYTKESGELVQLNEQVPSIAPPFKKGTIVWGNGKKQPYSSYKNILPVTVQKKDNSIILKRF